MIILIYITFSFYAKLENRYYIWIYNLNSRSFLIQKVKTGLVCLSIVLLPIYIELCFTFYNNLILLTIGLILCYAFLTAVILGKYPVYPRNAGIGESILIIMGILFPPFIFGVIYHFYVISKKRLNSVLI